jgi:hypothetical protein
MPSKLQIVCPKPPTKYTSQNAMKIKHNVGPIVYPEPSESAAWSERSDEVMT